MKKILMLLMLTCLCLTGCSKVDPEASVNVQFDGSSFTVEGVDCGLTMFNGYSGEVVGEGYTILVNLEQVDDLSYAQYNYFQITYDDMDLYRKEAYCWSMYGSTQHVMYYPYFESEDGKLYWISMACHGSTYEQAKIYMWDIAEKITMTNANIYVECGDDFVFGSEFSYPKVTTSAASVTGTIKVSKQQDPECTEPFTVIQDEKNTYTLYKRDSDRFSYYQYSDWLIQTAFGVDLKEYIKFK